MPTGLPALDLTTLRRAYRAGSTTPVDVVRGIVAGIARHADNPVFISAVPEPDLVARAEALMATPGGIDSLPLYGVPFAVKDNIDAAGLPTTAACPGFAHTPSASATAVERLLAAGAILVGKTNLDQFATGLVGTRSPWGAVRNAFDPRYVSGGSSSGSAVAVALGLASFALGTDTAGSGRVPAGFNNIVGLKPTRGLVSTAGVVPACRSLDCVSIFALTCDDACEVLDRLDARDPADEFARAERSPGGGPADGVRFGVPSPASLEFFGHAGYARLFRDAVSRLESLGGRPVEVDLAPFFEVAALLYGGPWVAERYAGIRSFIERRPDALLPVTREILEGAREFSAADAFAAFRRLAELKRRCDPVWNDIDALLVPTAPTLYTIDALDRDPVRLNSNLGRYTNFVNLLDLAAIAVPSGFCDDGLPFGVTLIGPALSDRWLAELGARYHAASSLPLGALDAELPVHTPRARTPGPGRVRLAVVGAHLSGQPLNGQLLERGARLVRTCRTAPDYRLYALAGTEPPKPGLVRAPGGTAIEVEVWDLPEERFGSFVAAIPAPLAIGTLTLEDGIEVKGFVCEGYATANARDISEFGGWRSYLAAAHPDPSSRRSYETT